MNTKFILYGVCLLLLCNEPSTIGSIVQKDVLPSGTHQTTTTQANVMKTSITPTNSQEHIAEEIIRLHVIANSDSTEDQALKIKVKDEIVAYLQDKLANASTKSQARQIVIDNLSSIEHIASSKMKEEGYTYAAKASLTYCDFPIKQYGDLTFPAGTYEALRIQLGNSEGRNWWCVMFPSLCKVDETYDEITEENKAKFREILSDEEYQSLLNSGENQVFYKSGIKSLLDKVIDYFPIKE